MRFFKTRKEKLLGLLDSEIYNRSLEALELELDLEESIGSHGVVDYKPLIADRKKIEELKNIKDRLCNLM